MSGTSPYLLYKELAPTSNIHLSRFFTPLATKGEDGFLGDEYLFTAAVSAITIYQVHRGDSGEADTRLIKVFHDSLYGKIQDVEVYRPQAKDSKVKHTQEQYLVLSLDDGKFCTMRFDKDTLKLEPINIYNSQENALGVGAIVKGDKHGHTQFGGVGLEPLVIVSDAHALGCSVVYGQQLFLFPLTSRGAGNTTRAAAATAGAAAGVPSSSSSSSSNSSSSSSDSSKIGKDGNIPFLYDLHHSLEMPGDIIDLCFVESYSKPTLAVLQTVSSLPIGHAKAQRHTCTLTVLALDTTTRTASKLWQQPHLPHDSLRLLSLKRSPLFQHGHVLLVSMNAILVLSQEQVVGASTNGFAALTVASHIRLQTWPYETGVELDGSHWLEAGTSELFCTLKDGRRLSVHITGLLDHGHSFDYLRFGTNFVASGPTASCCCANATGDLWFFGARDEQGTLVRVHREQGRLSEAERVAIVGLVLKQDPDGHNRALVAATTATTATSSSSSSSSSGSGKVKKEELTGGGEEEALAEEEAPPTKRARKAPAAKKKAAPKQGRGKAAAKKEEEEPEEEEDHDNDAAVVDMDSEETEARHQTPIHDLSAEEMLLYGTTLDDAATEMVARSIAPCTQYTLEPVDSVKVMGTIVSAEYCHADDSYDAAGTELDWLRLNQPRQKLPVGSTSAFVAEREAKECLQLSTGLGAAGSVTRASQGRRFVKMGSRSVAHASDVFTTELRMLPKPYSLVLMSFGDNSADMPSGSKVLLAHENWRERDGEEVRDVALTEIPGSDEGDGFVVGEVTVGLFELAPNVVLQAVRGGLRIVRLDMPAKKEAAAKKGGAKAAKGGRGRSNSVESESGGDKNSSKTTKIDPAAIAADFCLYQDVRVDASLSDGGFGCAATDFITSVDVLSSSSTGPGEAQIGVVTDSGSFFLVSYNAKECLARTILRQVADTTDPTPTPPTQAAERADMDVDNAAATESAPTLAPAATAPAPLLFSSKGDLDGVLPSAHSRVVGASFYRGVFPHCPPVDAEVGRGPTLTGANFLTGAGRTPTGTQTQTQQQSTGATGTTPTGAISAGGALERDREAASKVENEEEYLYGDLLGASTSTATAGRDRSDSILSVDSEAGGGEKKPSRARGKKGAASKTKGGSKKAQAQAVPTALPPVEEGPPEPRQECAGEASHLVLWTLEGSMLVLQLPTLQCVFYCPELSLMPNAVTVQRYHRPHGFSSEGGAPLPHNEVQLHSSRIAKAAAHNRRGLHHVRVCTIGAGAEQSLCIIAIALTGDLFIYRHTGRRDCTVMTSPRAGSSTGAYVTDTLFSKVRHSIVTRRRRNKILYNTRKLKALLDAGQDRAEAAQAADARMDSLDLESLQFVRSCVVPDPSGTGGNSVVIGGGTLCTVQNCGGLVSAMPLCLPEVHFTNTGAHALAPLAVPSLASPNYSKLTRGLFTLWLEHDADTVQAKTQRVGLLGLYQEAPGYFSLPGSSLTVKRQVVGRTVRGTSEVNQKGDDKVEQELLSRRTSVLACSVSKSKSFDKTKVSEAHRLAELALYDRYYPEMKSFNEPDTVMGAAPAVAVHSDSLILVQEAEPVSEFPLPDDEQVIAMEYCALPVEKISQSTYFQASSRSGMVPQMTKKKVFVVAGTAIKDTHGEDSPGKGHLLLFGLDYTSFQTEEERKAMEEKLAAEKQKLEDERKQREAAGGDPMDIPPPPMPVYPPDFSSKCTPKLKLLWSGPGPASIVKSFGDYVISAVDNILYVYRLVPQEMALEQIAFYSANIYIKSVSVERNYIIISDFRNSVQFLVWSRDEYTLTLLGKDYNPCVAMSTAFIKDSGALGMVVGDDESNLQLFMYAPLRAESKDGNRLLLQADFHLGCEASVLLQHSALFTAPAAATAQQMQQAAATAGGNAKESFMERIRIRQAALQIAPFGNRMNKRSKKDNVLVGTLEGSIGLLSAVEEKAFRRLALLQQIMLTCVQSVAALNPREYRLLKVARFRGEKKRGVLDGSLLYQYICMDGVMQDEIAAAMGVTADLLLDNLREIDLSAAVF